MILTPYTSKERVDKPRLSDMSGINAMVSAGQKIISEYQQRDLEQRNSDATIEMLNIETNITNKLTEAEKQYGSGTIDGKSYLDIASQIRRTEYKGFTPPPELKNKYNEQQALYQSKQEISTHKFYAAAREREIKDDFKQTYGDIAILATRANADENLEKINFLVNNMSLPETQRKSLLASSIEGHNNQMYRNEINNPDNNIEQLKLQYEAFKLNSYGVGLENHKTIDKLFSSKIKTKRSANIASDKAQKRYRVEQTITRFEGCVSIDSTGEGCSDFGLHVNDSDFTREQREHFKDFVNIQQPLKPFVINMAAGYSDDIDNVRSKLQVILADKKVGDTDKVKVRARKALDYIAKLRSQFELKIRQPDGIYFVIEQLNKGDDTDIMKGAERMSAEWMGKANSIVERLGIPEGERMLLPREVREQLATKPFETITDVLTTFKKEGWDDISQRVAIEEMSKVTGLPKGMSILLTQDNTKGIRALKNYQANKELYNKSDDRFFSDEFANYWGIEDSAREKLRLSGMSAEDINRFDSAIEIQSLSTWHSTNGEMDEIIEETYQGLVSESFTFGSDTINEGYLRFDSSKVTQDLADDYVGAVEYMMDEPEILDKIVNWEAIQGRFDKEEIFDLISEARVISTDNDTSFNLLGKGLVIPFRHEMTWEWVKEIKDKTLQEHTQKNIERVMNTPPSAL